MPAVVLIYIIYERGWGMRDVIIEILKEIEERKLITTGNRVPVKTTIAGIKGVCRGPSRR